MSPLKCGLATSSVRRSRGLLYPLVWMTLPNLLMCFESDDFSIFQWSQIRCFNPDTNSRLVIPKPGQDLSELYWRGGSSDELMDVRAVQVDPKNIDFFIGRGRRWKLVHGFNRTRRHRSGQNQMTRGWLLVGVNQAEVMYGEDPFGWGEFNVIFWSTAGAWGTPFQYPRLCMSYMFVQYLGEFEGDLSALAAPWEIVHALHDLQKFHSMFITSVVPRNII